MKEKIKFIPINHIRILNPRERDKKKFAKIVESIRDLGLKKPIMVNIRGTERAHYDLVYGQGRLEACRQLGYDAIPAIVVDVSDEDRLITGLVENIARRHPRYAHLIIEIQRLHKGGNSIRRISAKLGVPQNAVSGYLALSRGGEERLLDAAIRGLIPIGVAMDIAKTGDAESQQALLAAYEKKEINQASIRAYKKIIDQRRRLGKILTSARKSKTTSQAVVDALQKDASRKRILIRKAQMCENRLLFITGALRKLFSNEDFRNLLRAERLETLPDFLVEKINPKFPNAA